MKNICFFLLLSILIVSCGPSEASVQTAISQTETAHPTMTATSTVTVTPSPTLTSTPEQTKTPTNTPTPESTATSTQTTSPTPDMRVIDGNPKDFLLEKADLPQDAKYYLPNSNWISPHRNSEIVSGWGVDEGREYLEKTGRVDGWWVSYSRGTSTVIAPEEIYDNIVIYLTSEGAQLVMKEFSMCKDRDTEYTLIETDLLIGNMTNVCSHKEMQSNGEYNVWYRIEFSYRNFYHAVVGWGTENEVRQEYIEKVARTLLAKLEEAPLSDKVTFRP